MYELLRDSEARSLASLPTAAVPEKLLLPLRAGDCARAWTAPVAIRWSARFSCTCTAGLRAQGDRAQQARGGAAARAWGGFVEEETEAPEGETVVFSAHGVSSAVHANAETAPPYDHSTATCPLVTKVHVEAKKFAARRAYTIVLIGHEGHEEVEGTMGEAPEHFVLVETEEDVDNL